jgi:hypothetical protein
MRQIKQFILLLSIMIASAGSQRAMASCTLSGSITQQTFGNQANLTASISGGSGRYSYTWSHLVYANGNTFITYNNGIYDVTVTDSSTGCQIVLRDTVTNLPCSVQDSISVQFLGGGQVLLIAHVWGAVNPGYTWTIWQGGTNWINPTTDSVLVTLPAGLQSAYLNVSSQGSGCGNADSITFIVPSINCTLTGSILNFGYSTYDSLSAMVNGGSGHYQFSWSANGNNSNYNNTLALNNGVYKVTVTDDSTGCQIVLTDTVLGLHSPCNLHATISYQYLGGSEYQLVAHVSGSPATDYQWEVDDTIPGNGMTYGNNYDNLTVTLAPGATSEVELIVTDSVTGCVARDSVSFNVPNCGFFDIITTTQINSGEDVLSLTGGFGGTPPYSYHWSNGATGATDTISQSGVYWVTVTDSTGCQAFPGDTVTGLANNCTLAVSFHNTYGYNSCGVTATVTGAHGPLSGGWNGLVAYLLANNIDSISINNSGTYCFTISDSSGCVASACDSINIPACHLSGSLVAISATTSSDTFEAHVNNGTPPYNYEWASFRGVINTGTSPIYGVSPAQGVCVSITDSIGCVLDMCDSPSINPLSVSAIQDHPAITVVPNPFRDHTTITVSGIELKDVSLEIYSIVGQREIVSAPAADGVFHLDRGGLSGGIYIYNIRQGDRSIGSGKLVVEE